MEQYNQWLSQLTVQSEEPDWMIAARRDALRNHRDLPWPHPSDDIWRRTDASLLDPSGLTPAAEARDDLSAAQRSRYAQRLGDERLWVRYNGQWIERGDSKEGTGVRVLPLGLAAREHAAWIRPVLDDSGLTEAERKLASLNGAFHHDGVFIHVPADFRDSVPWRFVHLWESQRGRASFPRKVIRVEAGAEITLIDEYVGLEGGEGPQAHLVHGRIELDLQPGAKVHYVRVQRWGRGSREFLLQRSHVGRDAQLILANLNLGAALSKAHVLTRLYEPNASSRIYGFVFGRGEQHIDQHTLQDHLAPHTYSNLNFSAALQDNAHMVYTGLIRIAQEARQSEAFQENRNLLLDAEARADTIPMLEILADDVQCKHAAAAGPIDEEQVFYLMSRGIPRETAERLVVMGFVEPIIQQVPFEALRERLREEIEGELHIAAGV